MADNAWLRLKARTAGDAPSGVAVYPGLSWYEREVYDLFGVRFADHPDLRRIMLPDDWVGHPLRRDEPIGWEPIQFSKGRQEQYGD
jgi:NADH-quinone oxidoreductase subunit C